MNERHRLRVALVRGGEVLASAVLRSGEHFVVGKGPRAALRWGCADHRVLRASGESWTIEAGARGSVWLGGRRADAREGGALRTGDYGVLQHAGASIFFQLVLSERDEASALVMPRAAAMLLLLAHCTAAPRVARREEPDAPAPIVELRTIEASVVREVAVDPEPPPSPVRRPRARESGLLAALRAPSSRRALLGALEAPLPQIGPQLSGGPSRSLPHLRQSRPPPDPEPYVLAAEPHVFPRPHRAGDAWHPRPVLQRPQPFRPPPTYEERLALIVEGHRAQIQQCAGAPAPQGPSTGLRTGSVVLRWSADAEGRIRNARVVHSDASDPRPGRCVLSAVKRLFLPAPTAPGPVTFTFFFR